MTAAYAKRGVAMRYTIKQVAEMTGLTTVTIRYYDKMGLFPHLARTEAGYRVFDDDNVMFLKIVECLKRSGMSIKDICQFSEWVRQGDDSLQQRYDMFLERKAAVERQIADLQETLSVIEHKCGYYREAIDAGTEAIHFGGGRPSEDDRFDCER